MEIGIVGLPHSGKTTIFNAVTGGRSPTATYGGSGAKPNLGVAKVEDERLDFLGQVFHPKRTVPSEVIYVDFPATPEDPGKARGISGEYLNRLQRSDALLVVTRAFSNPAVQHGEDGVEPVRDLQAMCLELAFADLEILERRLARLAESSKGARATERDALDRERRLLGTLTADLEQGKHIRDRPLADEEARLLSGFQLLTAKPLIAVANVGEDQVSETPALEERMRFAMGGTGVRVAALCGTLEMELSQMAAADQQEFRESLGLGEPGLNRLIALSYEASDLVTFFTGNANEVRSWAVPRGTTALKAAGKIHSDFERGFIRAEVVSFSDLQGAGTLVEARRRGVLRREGKGYTLADGDVVNILFNV